MATTEEMIVTEIEGYKWCHAHGEVHRAERDPYDEGEDCSEHQIAIYADDKELNG